MLSWNQIYSLGRGGGLSVPSIKGRVEAMRVDEITLGEEAVTKNTALRTPAGGAAKGDSNTVEGKVREARERKVMGPLSSICPKTSGRSR